MSAHIFDTELALYASRDCSFADRLRIGWHLRQCELCRERARQFSLDAAALRQASTELPEGIDWARLSAEMTANIHVGLAAGECVAPRRSRKSITSSALVASWRPLLTASAIACALTLFLGAAWWLNMPAQDTQILSRAMQAVLHGRRTLDERGPVIEASSDSGIELRKDGGKLGVAQDSAQLVTVSVSTQGSASAHYVDQDTGQVTITSVYAQ